MLSNMTVQDYKRSLLRNQRSAENLRSDRSTPTLPVALPKHSPASLLESESPVLLSIVGRGHSPALTLVVERRDDLADRKLMARAEVGQVTARYSNEALSTVAKLWLQSLDALEGLRDIAMRAIK